MFRFLIYLAVLFWNFYSSQEYNIDFELEDEKQTHDSVVTTRFSAVGDLMCHETQFKWASVDEESFNFNSNFREVKTIFDSSDHVIGNFESVCAGSEIGYYGYPIFNTPVDFLESVNYAGFNLLVTANNHSFDQDKEGVRSTLQNIKKLGMTASGTFTSKAERDSIVIHDSGNIPFALLSYTYGLNINNVPQNEKYLVNIIDTALVRSDIINAREAGAEIVIVYYHFGKEYEREPNKFQKQLVHSTISYGADIILGCHPHTLQPIELFKTNNAALDSGFVAYSLGNFISNQRWRYSDCGVILNFSFEKNISNKKITLKNIEYIPIWVFKGITGAGKEYIILPTTKFLDNNENNFITEEQKELMKESLEDTREIMNKYSSVPREKVFSPMKFNSSSPDSVVHK